MSQPPERIVATGPYAVTRNPMYLGHIIFLAGLAAATRSRLVTLFAMAMLPWYDARAREDEQRLAELFGTEYEEYRGSVPRWISVAPRRQTRRGVTLTQSG